MTTLDAAEVAREAVAALAFRAREAGVKVEVALPSPFPLAADGRRLEQILVNLVDNAIKFNKPGGTVRIAGDRAEGRPRITVAVAQDIQALRAMVDRRRQLVEARTAEKNRRKQAPEAVIGSIDDHIEWLDKQIDALDRAIADAIQGQLELCERIAQLRARGTSGPAVWSSFVVRANALP